MKRWIGFAAVLCLLPVSVPAQKRAQPAERREIVGYYPQWAVYNRRFVPLDLVKNGAMLSLTQMNYAQANIKDNACVVADPTADLNIPFKAEDSIDGVADDPEAPLRGNFHQMQMLRARYPKLRLLISIEGKPELFAEAAKKEHREAFVRSCVSRFLEGHVAPGVELPTLFDGIDVDWEYPDAGQADDFYALMEEFRKQMDAVRWKAAALRAGTEKRGFTLSIASGAARKHVDFLDWARVAKSVDQINVMTYDYYGPWSRDTGFIAPLRSANPKAETVTTTINAYLAGGAPPRQMLLGIPFYAYQWHNVVAGANFGLNSKGDAVRGNLNQSTAATLMQEDDAVLHRDPLTQSPWIYDGDNVLVFEDADSLKEKMAFARQRGLGGAMVWDLSGDTNDSTLLKALARR